MNPLMPFLSETLYRALPGKSKTRLDHTKFPEPTEVYCIYYVNYYVNQYFNSIYNLLLLFSI